ncbi:MULTISPECIES: hypothetical protein [Microbacterium]|uniref:Uncharacterized protein n=1 Tax=Microbacterium testaceum TaxID=2033 RepID=A0A4Y3QP89_MICTE|nr:MULTISPECIES: hypothetical protein [Microbacterium]MDQ1176024.1 hypothetical protein [Microbacterium sp. SORGH_AS_0421]WAC69976.1 hypothetical protein OVA17_04600 [Microbacterium sp. SL75]GEB47134.1 hypothetical protein MTE01_30790 [Microbacterium testaceum]
MTEAARAVDQTVISDALVRYIGEGRSPMPVDDPSSVITTCPREALSLQQEIRRILAVSEAITLHDVGPFDQSLRHRLHARIQELFPGLSGDAVRAIGWRWGFLNLR